jgi:hypothetical protein
LSRYFILQHLCVFSFYPSVPGGLAGDYRAVADAGELDLVAGEDFGEGEPLLIERLDDQSVGLGVGHALQVDGGELITAALTKAGSCCWRISLACLVKIALTIPPKRVITAGLVIASSIILSRFANMDGGSASRSPVTTASNARITLM